MGDISIKHANNHAIQTHGMGEIYIKHPEIMYTNPWNG